jgi:FdhD protein
MKDALSGSNKVQSYVQIGQDHFSLENEPIIGEAPVSLTVNGEIWLTFMCTPIELEALAVGFLFNEGLLQDKRQLADLRVCPANQNVDIWTYETIEKPGQWRRTTGCTGGITSVAAEGPSSKINMVKNGFVLTKNQVFSLISALLEEQNLYRLTGGVHTSTLTDGAGQFITAEDIGRHNTLDKLAGKCVLEQIQLEQRILLTTGRISSEMLQKAARLDAAVVISRTSPSTLSLELAERYGITLIGYARRNRFNLYTHPERILAVHPSSDTQIIDLLKNGHKS